MRRLSVLALAILLIPLATTASGAGGGDRVRIAVIDTGIDAAHPEFAPGQIVAWRDFTAEASPTPKDGHGHGTATASLVAGLNVRDCGTASSAQKISFAPGADLIVARVGTDSGAITGNIENAIDWARHQGADVITMSIGATLPVGSGRSDAIERAYFSGVLMIVSAGNGVNNMGVAPYPTWMSAYGNNRGALVVGAADWTGQALLSTTGNHDPDVVSWGDSVCVARANTQNYTFMSGTSFSAPIVAGMAGGLAQLARDAGQPEDAQRLMTLLTLGARNNPIVPYAREGLGSLVGTQYQALTAHATAGTTPNYLAQGGTASADLSYYERTRTTLRE